jgi:nicotinate phosphoribosyltransferase
MLWGQLIFQETDMKLKNLQKAMLTDLYELTMAASYYEHGITAPATFSLFIRKYPQNRGYFVSAGLEHVLEFLESFSFDQEDLDYLDSKHLFSHDFLDYLSHLRFTGDVLAIEEGRIFFKDEPILELTAPIIQGQLVETFIINAVNLGVLIATKASRCIHVARGKNLVDFSLRRTHGATAGMMAARSCYIAGFNSTSNVLAGKLYDIPISGTMAHSYILSFDEEIDAFRAFFKSFPDSTVLLIDTYDTIEGAQKAAQVGKEMADLGFKLKAVRLDSGDMTQLSQEVRKIFDEKGLKDVLIFASGGFDEFRIAESIEKGAQIDAYGVGTRIGVSSDAPYTNIAYKLVEYDNKPVLKLSSGKQTLPSSKQIFRTFSRKQLEKDVIGLRNEKLAGEKMLKTVMKDGKRMAPSEPLKKIRQRFEKEFKSLNDSIKEIYNPQAFPVELSPKLKNLQEQVIRKIKDKIPLNS